ncbi:MAG TPA: creatininase family protein, partial [Marmoricola sp.]
MTEVPSLAQHRWPVLDGSRPLLLVPVGSTEQHGPALPLGADTMIATSVTQEVARRLVDDGRHVLVAPAVGYGASGEHEGFPGTISIGREALGLMLV